LIPISRSTKHQTLVVAKDHQAATLPLRLAYERMTLFMERINPSQLMVRIVLSENKTTIKFCNSIEQEFEHNLSQQIYISEKCWSIIVTAKNATIQMMRLAKKRRYKDADGLRQAVISDLLKTISEQCGISFYQK
jgi:hypothetical protein